MGEPSVLAICRPAYLFSLVRIPETVFCQKGGETVLDAVIHLSPYILLALVPYLVAPDVAELDIFFNLDRISSVSPFESGEPFVHNHSAYLSGTVRKAGSVISVKADSVRIHIEMVSVYVPDKQGIF